MYKRRQIEKILGTMAEYRYYRVIAMEDGTWYTVYAGYREWFRVY